MGEARKSARPCAKGYKSRGRVLTGQNSDDVPINERRAFAKRDARDRPRRVRPSASAWRPARQPLSHSSAPRHTHSHPIDYLQLLLPLRYPSPKLPHDGLRPLEEPARPAVIPEPGPDRIDVLNIARGERRHRGKPKHPPLKVRNHGGYLCLLEHRLRDPDLRVALRVNWPLVRRDPRAKGTWRRTSYPRWVFSSPLNPRTCTSLRHGIPLCALTPSNHFRSLPCRRPTSRAAFPGATKPDPVPDPAAALFPFPLEVEVGVWSVGEKGERMKEWYDAGCGRRGEESARGMREDEGCSALGGG